MKERFILVRADSPQLKCFIAAANECYMFAMRKTTQSAGGCWGGGGGEIWALTGSGRVEGLSSLNRAPN